MGGRSELACDERAVGGVADRGGEDEVDVDAVDVWLAGLADHDVP